jgi:WD40 repeat protein
MVFRLKKTLNGHSDSVNSVAFNNNGTRIVSGSRDKTVKIWNAASGDIIKTLLGHSNWVNSVAFSPNGTQIVSGSADKTVKIWNAATGLVEKTLQGHSQGVTSVAFSPNGTRIVSGSSDKTVKIWNAATGLVEKTLYEHRNSVNSVAFNNNGMQIVSGSDDGTVKIWNATTDGDSDSDDGDSGVIHTLLVSRYDGVESVAFSPNGMRVVSGSGDKTVKIWNAASDGDSDSDDDDNTLQGHTYEVYSVAFSPDGAQIVSGSGDKTVKIWNAATGDIIQTLQGHTGPVNSVAFSSDGSRIVSGSSDKTVKIWEDNGLAAVPAPTDDSRNRFFHTPLDEPFSFDITGKYGLDTLMGEDVSIKKHLNESKDNVVFVYLDFDSRKTPQIVAVDKSIVQKGIHDKDYIVYECNKVILQFRFIDSNDIKKTEYVNIKKLTGGGDLIYLDTLKYIYNKITRTQDDIFSRVFVFQREEKELETTASHDVIFNPDPNYSSARHCQEGQSASVYTLHKNVLLFSSQKKVQTKLSSFLKRGGSRKLKQKYKSKSNLNLKPKTKKQRRTRQKTKRRRGHRGT